MKLSVWAKNKGLTYRGAYNLYRRGQIPGSYQLESGTVIIDEVKDTSRAENIVVYCRVSNHTRKDEMEYQVNRCLEYCRAKGYSVNKVYKEVASGMNDTRKELFKMLDSEPTIIVVENKDRLTRFGFNYVEYFSNKNKCKIDVLNRDNEDSQDLIKDMVAVMTSFCCRLYGLRRGQNKAKRIKEVVNDTND